MQHDSFEDQSIHMLGYFGARMRTYRIDREMTQAQVGEAVHYASGYVGLVENGKRYPSYELAVALDALFDTNGEFASLWPLLHRGDLPSWFKGFLALENEAIAKRSFEPQFVPGLFQTEAYARALMEPNLAVGYSAERLDEQLRIRMARQQVLTREEPQLQCVILGEGVLRQLIGSPEIMREQLGRLVDIARTPGMLVQVLPFAAGAHPGQFGSLRLFTLPRGSHVVYLESYNFGQLLTRPETVAAANLRFDRMCAQALSPEASIDMIVAAMEAT